MILKEIQISRKRFQKNPNIYSMLPVMVVDVDFEPQMREVSNKEIEDYLGKIMPSLKDYIHTLNLSDDFKKAEDDVSHLELMGKITLALQNMAGSEVTFSTTRKIEEDSYHLVIQYKISDVASKALDYSLEIMDSIIDEKYKESEENIDRWISELKDIYERKKMGPSTEAIISAAESRNIPYDRTHSKYSLFSLGYGKGRKRIWGPVTSETSMIGADAATDKELTKKILSESGIPVPYGGVCNDQDDAVKMANEIGYPVLVKPLKGNHGRGVIGELENENDLRKAYEISRDFGNDILVEEFIEGKDYRFLIIDHKVVAVAERIPSHVVGDGESTIIELVEKKNEDPRRGDGHSDILTEIRLGAEEMFHLELLGLEKESILPEGKLIYLRTGGNLSTGGTAINVTQSVNRCLIDEVERASRAIDMDILGVDVIARDITKPPEKAGWYVIEINASPGLRMHIAPTNGKPIPAGEHLIEYLYPDGDGRIPIISITGTTGKTTTSRMVEWIFRNAGYRTGMAVTGGIYFDGECGLRGDTTGPWSAGVVLNNPLVEIAVLETARGGMIRDGLGFDECQVSVLTNIKEDHLGLDGIENLDDLFRVKSLILKATSKEGDCVINARDDFARKALERSNGKPILFSSLKDDRTKKFILEGYRVLVYTDKTLELYKDNELQSKWKVEDNPWLALDIPMHIENTLAALAASNSTGIPIKEGLGALKEFKMDEEMNPGRMNMFECGCQYFILDYAHNPISIEAVGKLTHKISNGQRAIVLAEPGDRGDDFLMNCGSTAEKWFDRIYITENPDIRRGREYGEISEIIRKGTENGKVIMDMDKAIKRAIKDSSSGTTIVFAGLDIGRDYLKKSCRSEDPDGKIRPLSFQDVLNG